MKFSFYATTLLLLKSLSSSQARMGSRSLEQDSFIMELIYASLGAIIEIFPFIEYIPVIGDIVQDINEDGLTYDEIVAQVITDFGYTEIPDPYCNITSGENSNNTLTIICDSKGKVTMIDQADHHVEPNLPASGFISTFIGELPELIYLWARTSPENDHLKYGTLPTEIGKLTNLEHLGFFNTGLSGSVPSEIGSLEKLLMLQLANSPDLTGTIPGGLDNLIGLSIPDTGISDFDDAYCDIGPSYADTAVPEDKCPEGKQENVFDHE